MIITLQTIRNNICYKAGHIRIVNTIGARTLKQINFVDNYFLLLYN